MAGTSVFDKRPPNWGVTDNNDEMQRSVRSGRGLLSSSAVGSVNRGKLLQALFDLGPTSRADLARYTGVNRATISGIIQPLIEQAVLTEGAPARSNESAGKPARPLWFSKDAQPICAVLLMHNSVHTALVSLDGTISAENKANFQPDRQEAVAIFEIIASCIRKSLAMSPRAALGIGVAAVGMIDTDSKAIVTVNLAPVLDGFPLGQKLAEEFGLPASIDHHPRALLVGDRWFGQGRGRPSFAAVYTGEVLGGALLLNGQVFRGPAGAGGELGHTFVQVGGRACYCGRRGCWETIATLRWLREEAAAAGLLLPDEITSERLVALVAEGVPGAVDLLDRYAHNIAVGIANLQQTMSPNFFVLHGDVVGGGSVMTDAIMTHLRALVPWRPGGDIELAVGERQDVAALRGAAGLVLSDLLHFVL